MPRKVEPGAPLTSGCVNTTGLLEATVTKSYADSTVSRILSLIEESGSRKAKIAQFITTFSRYYTPIVVIAAVLLATVPLLVIPGAVFSEWLYRALVFLVISCPCALVVSIPLGFFGGIGGAAKLGILVKGGNYLQALASVKTVVFDKTGTLTKGTFSVRDVESLNGSGYSADEILTIAAAVESTSNHPIALSLVQSAKGPFPHVEHVEELSGFGIRALLSEKEVLAGQCEVFIRQWSAG